MALNTRQKWGIGGLAYSVVLGIVSGFAIAGQLAPEVVYVASGLAVIVLAYFGITNMTIPPRPPE